MRILLTGASGFIGRHTEELLRKTGHEVLPIGRDTADWRERTSAYKPEVAIHLAWEGIPDYGPEMSMRNFEMSRTLFDFLTALGVPRIVGVGSGVERVQHNDFTVAKNAARAAGEALAAERGVIFLWARLFFVYGPRQRQNALIPSIVRSLGKGNPAKLKTPEAQNDFVYVGDGATALMLLATGTAQAGTYEVGSGILASVGEVAQIAYEKFGMNFTVPLGGRNQEPPLIADIAPLRALGWEPRVSLTEGVSMTVDWFKTHTV